MTVHKQQKSNPGTLRFLSRRCTCAARSTPPHCGESCSLPGRWPNPNRAIPVVSGHDISTEHRLRRKHQQLISDTDACNEASPHTPPPPRQGLVQTHSFSRCEVVSCVGVRRPVSGYTFCSIPSMSFVVGAHAQWRRHESAKDRR